MDKLILESYMSKTISKKIKFRYLYIVELMNHDIYIFETDFILRDLKSDEKKKKVLKTIMGQSYTL